MITLEQHLTEHMYLNTPDGWECCDCGWREELERASGGAIFTHAAHIAATWREARTVRTVEQLDALPTGTVMRDKDEFDTYLPERKKRGWRLGDGATFSSEKLLIPGDDGEPVSYLVVWTPEDGAL